MGRERLKPRMEAETTPPTGDKKAPVAPVGPGPVEPTPQPPGPMEPAKPKRYHGTVALDPARVGRDASRVADEVITHLVGLVGSTVRVTLEIEAEIPDGAPNNVVRIVTENGCTLKFTSGGFEKE